MLLTIALIVLNSQAEAKDSSNYYFVCFKDKQGTVYNVNKPWEFVSVRSIDRRQKYGIEFDETDLPVNQNYIDIIATIRGVQLLHRSKWLNGVEIRMDNDSELEHIKNLNFVREIIFLGRIKLSSQSSKPKINAEYYERSDSLTRLKASYRMVGFSDKDYNHSMKQNNIIGVPFLHNYGFRGQRQYIAVFDAGFNDAYKVKGMEDLLSANTITVDFVDNDSSVWEDDSHGAKVLSFMKTFNPGYYIGSAPFADYALFRTEIDNQEFPVEEINWLFAAEYADSLGIDLISSSVGYHAFDDPSLSYPYKSLDGKTSIISKAAGMAFGKGIVVICSAGNEGANAWKKLSTPGDAAEVMTIGASDMNGFYSSFSSMGPSADGRIKPDFSAPGQKVSIASPGGSYAGNGTSYSTPLFAGGFACLMGALPNFQIDSIKKYLRMASTHYRFADTLYGYGIPDFGLAYCLASGFSESDSSESLWVKSNSVYFQDLNIYFKSQDEQKIKITVKTDKGSKMKKSKSKTYKVKKGDWLRSDLAFECILNAESKRKKKREIKKMLIIIETSHGTYQREFSMN